MATKAIVGEKLGMTQVWDEQNRAIPVTVVKVAPARVRLKRPEAGNPSGAGGHTGIGNREELACTSWQRSARPTSRPRS